jgi:hypothetical protein
MLLLPYIVLCMLLFEYFVFCILILIILSFVSDETKKWEKITYLGIASCTLLAAYILSKGHHHYDEPPVSFPLIYGIWSFNSFHVKKFLWTFLSFSFFHEHFWNLKRIWDESETQFSTCLLFYDCYFDIY